MIMATTKNWAPNEKQTAFMGALQRLGKVTLRQVNAYFESEGMELLKTGSINILITKGYVKTEKVKTPMTVTTEYHYGDTVITETKESEKEETAYEYVEPENRVTFDKSNAEAKGKVVAKSNPTEEELDEELVDMEEE